MPMPKASKEAIVIGSGFGGIACAIRLQAMGFATTIYEALDKPGGRAYLFEQDGFKFDAGPTVITAPECLHELFALSGRRLEDYVELVSIEPMYRLFWHDGERFDYSRDATQLLSEMKRLAPADARRYQSFFDYTAKVYEAGYVALGHVAFLRLWDMLKVVPQLLRVRALRSVYRTVAHYFKNDKIRQAFSFNTLLIGGNPFAVSSIYTLIHPLERKSGVYCAKGGTHALVRGLLALFADMGGRLVLAEPVARIVTEGGRAVGVQLKSGGYAYADAVVSNGDVHHTYQKLLADEPRARPRARSLARKHFSMSLFVIYFGTNRDWPELHHHNIMFGPRYRELLSDIFDRGHLADDFSLYLHAPSKSDPTLAPAGHHAFYVLAPVPHLGLAPLDWEAMGEAYADRIVTYLEERYMPGLRQSIVTQRLRTPLDFQNQLAAPFGSAFSLEPRLTQSAWFRVHNRDPRIARLYFVGAGTHPGAGIPGVVGSAKATALVIAQDQPQSLQQYTHEAIAYGSQSFAFASRLLGAQQRQGITALYAWCRYCDDQIDRLPADASLVAKQEVLASLREQTLAAYEGRTSHAAFGLFADVVARYQIPQQYPLALLEGMAMDVQGDTYATFSDLRQYCHRVAGVVGIMFSYIVGVSHAQALAHADHLGIAMQLTNIARDVKTDYELGRLYLPQSWLAAEGVDPAKLFAPEQRAALGAVVDKLLAEADTYYQSGLQGLVYLPAQAAVAVHAAAQIYRDIGEQVRAAGSAGLERRQWTSKRRKIWLACRSVPKTLFILARRWRTPWQRAALPAALNEATPASKLAT